MKTGVTEKTTERHVLDAGVIVLNPNATDSTKRVLGATRGGSEFVIEHEWRDMPYDGVPGKVKGARRLVGVNVTLTTNLVEIDVERLKLALPGSEFVTVPAVDENGNTIDTEEHRELTRALTHTIPDFELNEVALYSEFSHHEAPYVSGIKNAMTESNLSMSFAEKDESVLAITFTGLFDPADLVVEPWYIKVPVKKIIP